MVDPRLLAPEIWPRVPLPLLRQPGWEKRLLEWADSLVGQSFAWGTLDCSHLVTGAITALTRVDVRAGLPAYQTIGGATRVVHSLGGFRAAVGRLGLVPVPVAYAQSGDVLLDSHTTTAEMACIVACAAVVGSRLLLVERGADQVDRVTWGTPPPVDTPPGVLVLRLGG